VRGAGQTYLDLSLLNSLKIVLQLMRGNIMMKVLVAIPAKDEELTIGTVVAMSKQYGDVLVVDDGSKDKTSKVAELSGAKVLKHEINRGKADALLNAFKYAIKEDYDIVVCLDADGQHNPCDIPKAFETYN